LDVLWPCVVGSCANRFARAKPEHQSFAPSSATSAAITWQYCWPHVVYHMIHLYPRDNQPVVGLLLLLVTAGLFYWPFMALYDKTSNRYCASNLIPAAVLLCVMSVVSLGFTACFILRWRPPAWLRLTFHGFGIVSAIISIYTLHVLLQSTACQDTTSVAYDFVLGSTIVGLVATVIFGCLAIFWVREWREPGTMLDVERKRGQCYNAYRILPCVWHV